MQFLPEIAFISGPIDGANESYFHIYYVPRIQRAVERGDNFVIGPIPTGVDADALAYLLALPRAAHSNHPRDPGRAWDDGMWGVQFRAFGVHVHVVGGHMSRERDAALTEASTYDILRVRTVEETKAFCGDLCRDGYVTNTERNWKRRRGIAVDDVVDPDEINRSETFWRTLPLGRPEVSCENGPRH